MDTSGRILQYLQDRPALPLTFAVGSLYAAYYLCVVVKRPQIACGDKRLQKLIERHCPVAREYYWPTWWCFQAHVMTLLRALVQSWPHVDYRGELLPLPDGGQVKLDWADNDNSPIPSSSRPTVILLPGLTGASDENYVLHMVQETLELGYRCVVFNNRGQGGADLLTPRTYCATNTEDLECVVSHINKTFPNAKIMGVGVSLGAVILFQYLANKGKEAGLCAGMCISVTWNLPISADSLERPLSYLFYNKYLARNLVKKLKSTGHMFKNDVDVDHALKSRTIREFDERFTSKQFGYESCEDYYKDASLHHKIHLLHVPVLTLNAADDTFSPLDAIPVEKAKQNDNIAMVITAHGGHIGFLEGSIPRDRNYMFRWFSQYVDAVFKHGFKDD
ncbi:phospholipase ABHD3-like isoform X2 [Littorina saxatilis]|uniref:Phospholipase ABHD3 n=2 Tax=Littorina saxatilis TaxID=31220 RepID=A0AAN9ARF2_9CAEN